MTDPAAPVVVNAAPAQRDKLWFDPNWRDFHKLWSMRVQFVLMAFTAAYMIVPAFINWLPPRLFGLVVILLVFGGGIFRLMNQKGVEL